MDPTGDELGEKREHAVRQSIQIDFDFATTARSVGADQFAPGMTGLPSDIRGLMGLVRHVGSVESSAGMVEEEYILGEELGRGAMGIVMQANCRNSGQARAVKTMEPTEKQKADLALELDISRTVHHPNIIRLHKILREGVKFHLVMELCTGGSLNELINRNFVVYVSRVYNLSTELFGLYGYQMLSGLAYLHHLKIVHRDIKPQNYVLASPADRASLKLTDFGLATRFTPGKPLTRNCGSLFTTAPEVLECSYNELCDVWSVGVTCFIMGVGYAPFKGATMEEMEAAILSCKISHKAADWELHPPEAWKIVQQLLTLDPQKRPTARSALAQNPWLRKTAREPEEPPECCAVL